VDVKQNLVNECVYFMHAAYPKEERTAVETVGLKNLNLKLTTITKLDIRISDYNHYIS
jgi:hypothetical protein